MTLHNSKHCAHHIMGNLSMCWRRDALKHWKVNVRICFENMVSKCINKNAKTALIPFLMKMLVCNDKNIHIASFCCLSTVHKRMSRNETFYVSSDCFCMQKWPKKHCKFWQSNVPSTLKRSRNFITTNQKVNLMLEKSI